MSSIRPANLGVLACPGGKRFADEIIAHLKSIYLKKFDKKTTALAHRYGMPKEQIVRAINLYADFASSGIRRHVPVDSYRAPSFRIDANFTRFSNGEFKTEVLSTIRGMDIYIVQDIASQQPLRFHNSDEDVVLTVNDHLMCLLVTIDAAMQAGANSVTLVLPAYPYARQHKKKGKEGLTAARLGQMFENAGVSRIITLDIHSREIENSFNHMRLENLHASYQIIRKLAQITDLENPDLIVVSPDTGAVDRNKFYASSLKKPLGLLYKERDYSKLTKSAKETNITTMRLLGDVSDKIVFMADDMLGTGGTLIKAMRQLKSMGARQIICAVSIPFFTGSAAQDFEEAYREGLFYRIIGTNAVFHGEELLGREWYISANISDLFARIVSRLHHNQSLSTLLDNADIIQNMLKKRQEA